MLGALSLRFAHALVARIWEGEAPSEPGRPSFARFGGVRRPAPNSDSTEGPAQQPRACDRGPVSLICFGDFGRGSRSGLL